MKMVVMFPAGARRGLLIAACLTLVACSSAGGADRHTGGQRQALRAVASFYPLQWVTQQVLGPGGRVQSLTKPGTEPHDLELTAQNVAAVSDADIVVYLKGLQPAVDEAVESQAEHGFDVSSAAELNLTYTPMEEGEQHADEAGDTDPHFWLDPMRLAKVSDVVAAQLAELDADRASTYRDNARTLRRRLESLDREYRSGLGNCANSFLVTSHNAFGYLAQRYGLEQVGITGLTPDEEPKPADLAAAARFVRENQVRTIYYETLVSPAVARTVAAETGAQTAVLDPIEGLTSESAGNDYVEVMRSNLANIKRGQPCP